MYDKEKLFFFGGKIVTVDYHVHCIAHGERKSLLENYNKYIEQARLMDIKEIGFAEHDEYLNEVDFETLLKIKKETRDIAVKIGVEMEMPKEESGFEFLNQYPLDYVIASVHIIDDWLFDHPDNQSKHGEINSSTLYRTYFEKLARLFTWKGYNIIGHLDLIKIFGVRSDYDYKSLLRQGLISLRNKDCAVEVNTAGRYKPIGEIYPSTEILKWLYELDVPITISSDAHCFQDVGRDNVLALELLKKIGYRKIAVFNQRKRDFIAI